MEKNVERNMEHIKQIKEIMHLVQLEILLLIFSFYKKSLSKKSDAHGQITIGGVGIIIINHHLMDNHQQASRLHLQQAKLQNGTSPHINKPLQ